MFQGSIAAQDAPLTTPAAFRLRMAAETGRDYARFRRSLTPRFGRVRAHLLLGYAALAGLLALIGQAQGPVAGLAAAAAGAVAIGYVVAFLQLFIHEAAHYNLAATRKANDRIADWLVAWQVGTSIAAYRRTHAEHHRHLGAEGDSEISYRSPLTVRFLAEMVTGVHALRVFLARRGAAGARPGGARAALLRGVAIHCALLALLVATGAWAAALAWIGGIAVAYPLFATVRQVLEHRPTPGMRDAGDSVTRLFGDGPLAATFGGAGFNRHLLHHLEPQLSYTRLRDLEDWLAATSMGPVLDSRRATYAGTFLALLRQDRG